MIPTNRIALLIFLIFGSFVLKNGLGLQQRGGGKVIGDPNIPGSDELSQICRQNKKCGLCQQTRGCVWCNDPKYTHEANSLYDRCNTHAGHGQDCTQFEQQGKPSTDSRQGGSFGGSIQPSEYDVTLWVGQKVNISFAYTDSGNKPLDLYYLMDLSQTMEDDKDAVSRLGGEFASALKSVTKDLRMGFGSFVDKPVMPYAAYSHINHPEPSKRPPYGFENQLPLTVVNRTKPLFETTVRDAQISVNLDAPEGGLDAMMQVMECWEQIGWRHGAHRILVVSTDGTFHIAGDGKLGGIVIPNDGKCHMDNSLYVGTLEYDYPSVSQIVAKIRQKQIYVIFAVQQEVLNLYKTLSSLVSEYASTIRLDAKSTDVGRLVREQYAKIRSTVELSYKPTLKESELGVTYYVICGKEGNFIKGNKCTELVPNAVVEFVVEFELKRCPTEYSDREWAQILEFTPTGSQESLKVNLHLKCGCECEGTAPGNGAEASCTGRGSIECGICKCNEGYTGDRCQCDRSSESEDVTKCSKLCGGPNRGSCTCGACVCNKGFSGNSCECDDSTCPCVTESHGDCKTSCGKCSCYDGYSSVPGQPACTCSSSHEGCLQKGEDEEKKVCGGKGSCFCNRCRCQENFVGKYCNVCQRCDCLDEFVQCSVERENKTHIRLGKKGENSNPTCGSTVGSNVTITTLYPNISITRDDEKKCPSTDFDGCSLEYIFGYDESEQTIEVRVRSRLDCPIPLKATNPVPIIFGTVFSILFLGILTLILWKIITYLMDKHEFNKFETECQNRKWEIGGNPLYKEATSTFQNPAYTD